jgi:hypothetical protein
VGVLGSLEAICEKGGSPRHAADNNPDTSFVRREQGTTTLSSILPSTAHLTVYLDALQGIEEVSSV